MKNVTIGLVIFVCLCLSRSIRATDGTEVASSLLSPSQALTQVENYMQNIVITFNLPRSYAELQEDLALTRQELNNFIIIHNNQQFIPIKALENLMDAYHQRLKLLYPEYFIKPPIQHTITVKTLLQKIGFPIMPANISVALEQSRQRAEKIAPVTVASVPVSQPVLRSRHRRP